MSRLALDAVAASHASQEGGPLPHLEDRDCLDALHNVRCWLERQLDGNEFWQALHASAGQAADRGQDAERAGRDARLETALNSNAYYRAWLHIGEAMTALSDATCAPVQPTKIAAEAAAAGIPATEHVAPAGSSGPQRARGLPTPGITPSDSNAAVHAARVDLEVHGLPREIGRRTAIEQSTPLDAQAPYDQSDIGPPRDAVREVLTQLANSGHGDFPAITTARFAGVDEPDAGKLSSEALAHMRGQPFAARLEAASSRAPAAKVFPKLTPIPIVEPISALLHGQPNVLEAHGVVAAAGEHQAVCAPAVASRDVQPASLPADDQRQPVASPATSLLPQGEPSAESSETSVTFVIRDPSATSLPAIARTPGPGGEGKTPLLERLLGSVARADAAAQGPSGAQVEEANVTIVERQHVANAGIVRRVLNSLSGT
jgi:hypothetical protein